MLKVFSGNVTQVVLAAGQAVLIFLATSVGKESSLIFHQFLFHHFPSSKPLISVAQPLFIHY